MKSKPKKRLEPPDLERCQADKPNGATFMTLGGRPGLIRCRNKSTVIATEVKPGPDGQTGSMALCDDCLVVMQKQMPGAATFVMISSLKKPLRTLTDVRLRVTEIEKTARDAEAAHALEDDLYVDLLHAVAEGKTPPDRLRLMARIALTAQSVRFPRWTA